MASPPDRADFEAKLTEKLAGKRADNCAYLTPEKYQQIIRELKEAKVRRAAGKDQRRLNRYETVNVNGEDRLIIPVKAGEAQMRFYVSTDQLYDVLLAVHVDCGHGGKNKMLPLLARKYANVTQEVVLLFLNLCGICLLKRQGVKRGHVVKPMVFKEMGDRCQVDLIDFQSHPDGDYKFIMTYIDHLTKFVVLRPLKSKTAAEVVQNLLDIFLLFGAPCVLHSDNGREFVNQWLEGLAASFPSLKIVHGTPRHSQCQGLVEKANQTVQRRLMARMKQEKSTAWSQGLPFVQYYMNSTVHEGTKVSPYEAMFGAPMRMGLGTTLPTDAMQGLRTDEDLERFLLALG